MTFTVEQLESAMADCLAGKTPTDKVTRLAQDMEPEDLTHLVPYLSQGPHPDSFFEYWARKGKKTINGFYAMLDMFSALVYAQGQPGVDRLVPHLSDQSPYLERVLTMATDRRFHGEIIDRFLTGNAAAEPGDPEPCPAGEPTPVDEPRALREGDASWELAGESVLLAEREAGDDGAVLRLSLTNGLSPIEGVRLYVRITGKAASADTPSLHPGSDWQQADLVEEIVEVGDRYWLKGAAPDCDPTEEIPWTATFTASYAPPAHAHTIQLMIVDPREWTSQGTATEPRNSTVIEWDVSG